MRLAEQVPVRPRGLRAVLRAAVRAAVHLDEVEESIRLAEQRWYAALDGPPAEEAPRDAAA